MCNANANNLSACIILSFTTQCILPKLQPIYYTDTSQLKSSCHTAALGNLDSLKATVDYLLLVNLCTQTLPILQ